MEQLYIFVMAKNQTFQIRNLFIQQQLYKLNNHTK